MAAMWRSARRPALTPAVASWNPNKREAPPMLSRDAIMKKLGQAREDIDLVIDSVLQGDKVRVNWTRLLAHHVNNHLASVFFVIESFAELGDNENPDQLAIYTNGLRDLAGRIQETMRRLMAVAQMDALVQVTQVDFGAVVSEALSRHAGYAQLKSIQLREKVAASPPVIVRADRLALIEVVLNLIGNAIKYSPLGSEVDVSMATAEDHAVCEVRDHGPGISPEEQSKLFTIGGILSSKPTAGEPQTGIGLAMCQELVKTMGGTLWCESTPGHGATFGIRLPLADRLER
jgi:signal transduction histidine kinase